MENQVVNNIKKIINNKLVKIKLDNLINGKIQNNFSCDNLYACFDLQAKLVLSQIFVGDYEIEINEQYLENIINNFEGTIVDVIQRVYKPKTKLEFLQIVTNNYLINGYMCHGTSRKHFENIIRNGLNGNNNFRNIEMLNEVNDIFLSHKRKKCFEGKMNLLSSNSFYLSDNIYSGIYYAYQSPEYFSRFCANGHLMKENCYDNFAYFRRDKRACRENLQQFCRDNKFAVKEQQSIMSCFDILWAENVHINEKFYLCLIPRSLVNRIEEPLIKYLSDNIKKLTKKQIINILIRPRYIHDKTYSSILPKNIQYVQLVDLYKKFTSSSKGKKYIMVDDKKYVYDIVLDVPNKNKKFFVFRSIDECKIRSDIVLVSKINEERILKKYVNTIANECTANTAYGNKIIKRARTLITLEKLKLKLLRKAILDLNKCKLLLHTDLDKCFKLIYKMLFGYVIVLKTMIDNNDWFSNLNTADYYTTYGILDPDYLILKAKDSKVYDYDLLSSRIENIERFINNINKESL